MSVDIVMTIIQKYSTEACVNIISKYLGELSANFAGLHFKVMFLPHIAAMSILVCSGINISSQALYQMIK